MSRYGSTEHIKRACFQGGYEWRTPAEDVDFTDPSHLGWIFIDNEYIPKWYDSCDTVDVKYLTQVFSCKKDFAKIESVQKTSLTAYLTVGAMGNV